MAKEGKEMESAKSPGAGGNKHHDSGEGTFRAPEGDHTAGTMDAGGSSNLGPGAVSPVYGGQRPTSAHSSLLPARIDHTGAGE